MARATTVAWMSVAVAIALAPAGLRAQTQAPTETGSAAESANTRPSQVHVAFRSGTQCYQQGDYDRAAGYFQQAQAGQENLSAADQQSLAQWVQLNSTALKAGRDGGDLLRRAEEAVRLGRTQDALTYLKAVTPNQQFLASADKQRFQQLSERLMPLGTDKNEPAGSGPVGRPGSQALARSKVKQARLLLSNGNYAAAQALAQEADRLGANYTATEDTPQKVLADINQARLAAAKPGDAKSLLTAARAALAQGELDRAEQLAHQAEKATSVWTKTTHLFGDSPSKVLKDIQAERTRQVARKSSSNSVQQASSRTINSQARNQDTAATSDNTEVARRLLKEARLALQAGNVAEAKQLAERARALKPDLKWWDDTPDKLLAEIHQVEGAKKPGQTKDGLAESKEADPRSMIKQARELYNAGKMDEAEKLALRASSARPPRRGWGLFEDTPDKLLVDIKKARSRNDQEESVRVLAQARKLYEQGSYAEAKQLAHKAERLHGPYSLLDLGDRPAKLLVEIQTAESKSRANQLPPAPPGMVKKDVQQHATPAWPGGAQQTENSQLRTDYAPQQTENSQLRTDGAPSPTPYATRQTAVSVAAQPAIPAPPTAMDGDKKFQAQMLLNEARQLQREGRLVEARQRALAAQKTGVTFGPNEDRPEQALLAIGALCQRRIESLMQQANEVLNTVNADASRYAWAAQQLTQARNLAVTFGFDTQLIDLKLASAQPAQGRNGPTVDGTGVPSVPRVTQVQHQEAVGSPQNHGKTLLDQARRELYAGNTGSARRLAEAAYEPQYGMQVEAEQVLRSIDAEEFNQRVLTSNRSYDAGIEAFRQQRYAQAATIFRSIDAHQLTPEKQARLKEIMLVPEMQPSRVVQTGGQRSPVGQGAGAALATDQFSRARASDAALSRTVPPDADFAKQVMAMQEVRFQALRNDGLEAQRRAMELFKAGETDRALEVLEEHKGNLNNAGLDSERLAMLRGHIDSRLQQLKTLKHQRDFEKLQANQNEALNQERLHKILNEEEKTKRVAELMRQYQTFYKEGKYQEAQVAALKARDLDPDNPAAGLAVYQSETMANQVKYKKVKDSKEQHVNDDLDDAEYEGPTVNIRDPLHIDPERTLNGIKRKPIGILGVTNIRNENEREIYRKLDGPISSMDFKDTPLKQVLEDLHGWTGINIVADTTALNEAGINVDRPVTMKLENIMLKSALNLLLRQVHLTYVVKDEVLQITTEENARGKLETRIHPVPDLVIPVENSTGSLASNAIQALGQGAAPNLQIGGATPYQSLNSMGGGKTVSGSQMVNNMVSPGGMGAPAITKENPRNTTEEVLIKLIQNTIAPQSWNTVGGQGTIEFFPMGFALVINQTPDIQEQIAELLQALRRLQDQEVAVEMRFITISESFFERIGLNFNINIRNNQTKYEPQLVSQQFKPFGFINHFTPSNFISGLTPAGTFTQDLNIPIPNNSFNMAIPPFGQYPNIPGNNGGLSMGLAFLSDIEVFLFMEAAQGDTRTNVMEAPKLTMFNGQFATITITDLQFFVTAVTVAQVGGQVVFVPLNTPLPTGGLTMGILPTISADRRFVRLSVTPALTQLANNNVPLFPITTFITPIFEGGAVGQPIPFTQFLQEPAFNIITVLTTVNVPDGGTVLLGGLKRLLEGRNEFGPPILSKIPYINRLFKNVGYGRDAESLMIMITPRIIINEEEELRQVPGLAAPGPPGQ